MSEEWQGRLERMARRLTVVALVAGVVGVSVGTVRVAADWRSVAAPLDAAPISMDTIAGDAAAEDDRAGVLSSAVDDTAAQIAALRAVIAAADANVTTDTGSASALRRQLDASAKRLRLLQAQMKAAQSRLSQLNAAADRQAALNAAARAAGAAASRSGGGEEEGERGD